MDAGPDLSITGDEDFAAIEAEIDKLGRPTSSPVDWQRVAELGKKLLDAGCADLRVAVRRCAALLQLRGAASLGEGLEAVLAMLRRNWDGVHPRANKARGRLNQIAWLCARIDAGAVAGQPGAVACARRLLGVRVALRRRLGKEGDGGVLDKLRATAQTLACHGTAHEDPPPSAHAPTATPPADRPEPPAATSASAPAPGAATDAGVPGTTPPKREARQALRGMRSELFAIAAALRTREPSDPTPYSVLRFALWTDLQDPERDAAGRCVVRGKSPEDARSALARNFGTPAEQVEHLETLAQKNPLWLAPHQRQWSLLDALGPQFHAARDAVLANTRMLVGRMPTLLDGVFGSGLPFADSATRAWLESDPGTSTPRIAPPLADWGDTGNGEDDSERPAEPPEHGDFASALGRLQERQRAAASGRARLCHGLALARYCVTHGAAAVAAGHLERLAAEVDRFRLDEWEPALAAEVFALWLESLDTQDRRADPVRAQCFARLCGLDPVRAATRASA